jgi:DNA polymerase-3 subunit alpha
MVPRKILDGDRIGAKKALQQYIEIFGRENVFLEIMDHGLTEEARVNPELALLAQEFEVGLVATNDAHYLRKKDSEAHDALLCIGTQKTLKDPDRLQFGPGEFYVKSTEEMAAWAAVYPGAIANTVRIAERCNVAFNLNSSENNHYPVYRLPDNSDDAKNRHCPVRKHYLRSICVQNLSGRYGFQEGQSAKPEHRSIIERMDYELDVIDRMGFISYFLVVWDFIHWAKQHGIPVGPGRGSGAGSIVAYLTGITDIDPLRYNLLFERFLNPDRVSPPDFDIDLCERRRSEVIEYVRNKYGSERVCQIITFGTLKTKAVLKDVARVMGRSFADGNMITSRVPNELKITLEKALASKEIKELKEENDAQPDPENRWIGKLFEIASVLEGLNRNPSIHAAGVIIGDQPLSNIVPVGRGTNKESVTQFPAGPCEMLGLLKMDFLGLRTLTIVRDALDLIADNRGKKFEPSEIPLDDPKTYDLLNKGNTIAVFQLESTGMQDTCRKFRIQCIEDIIAILALYRPGPMEFIDTYVRRKKGEERVEYETPEMEKILRETYGIMIYQEQIMQVVQAVAGFTLAQADLMRRAIGKKKSEVLLEQGEKFVQGCCSKGHSESIANRIWEQILKFANYGFNKSHSAAYGLLAYQTAYLKANYPSEFMAAVLSSELGDAEKIRFLIDECREMGIEVRPPSINKSLINFSVDVETIVFGLGAIKGIGESAACSIIESRRSGGPFASLADFCERVGRQINSKKLESLIKAGAFDCMKLKRSQLVAMIEDVLSLAAERIRDREIGQASLFDMLAPTERNAISTISVPDIPEFDEHDMLQAEKALLGFYVSGHPLVKYAGLLKAHASATLKQLPLLRNDAGVKVGGIIKSVSRKNSKKNNAPYAILLVEDLKGTIECMVYDRLYETELRPEERPTIPLIASDGTNLTAPKVRDLLTEERPIFIEALVSKNSESDTGKIVAQRVIPMERVHEIYAREIHLHLYEGNLRRDDLRVLYDTCKAHPGKSRLILCITCVSGEIGFIETPESLSVSVSDPFLQRIRHILGENKFKIKTDPTLPEPRRRFNREFNGNG